MSAPMLGALIPKLHADKISPNDAKAFLREIASSAEFREACMRMGHLARDLNEAERKARALTCFELLLATTSPSSPLPPPAWPPKGEVLDTSLQPEFAKHFTRKPYCGMWNSHVHWGTLAGSNPPGNFLRVSHTLEAVLLALEGFWGLPGYIVQR